MKKVDDYKNKNVLVFGAGMSGTNAAELLVKLGAKVTLTDAKPADQIKAYNDLQNDGVKVVAGKSPVSLLDGMDLMVKNPGIPYDNELVKAAQSRNIPIIVELELAAEVSEAPLVGVTGSNGKTTTTTMITKMLQAGKQHGTALDGGNIGIPATKVAQEVTKEDVLVLEISSFMLLGTPKLHPHIAVITNIFSNHLDYHKTRENYVNAKMQITKNQTKNDYLVINFDSEEWRELSKRSNAQIIPFSLTDHYQNGAYVSDGDIYFKDEFIMHEKDIRVPGEQNVQNALAAIAVAKLYEIPTEAIVSVLKNFGGVRHRVQYVLTADNREFYNDSKATDIEATQMALRGFDEPIVLLAGGLDRGYTFDKLVPDFKDSLAGIVLFGQTADLLEDAAKKAGVPQIKKVKNLDEAVPEAFKMSKPGDIVLLSPANASWDQFATYRDRGDEFIKDVEKLTGKKETN